LELGRYGGKFRTSYRGLETSNSAQRWRASPSRHVTKFCEDMRRPDPSKINMASAGIGAPFDDSNWHIATDAVLIARRRFRGIADMDRFSSRNDL
jgi:hypothetical protein